MEHRASADPERNLEGSADELEGRIGRLDEHIDESKREVRARREESEPFEDVAGDWEDTDDAAGGEDPTVFDDPERLDDEDENDEY